MSDPASQSIDDILSSIKNTVAEESERHDALPETDLPEAGTPAADAPASNGHDVEDDLVDIDAFAEGGDIKAADDGAVDAARGTYNGEEPPEKEAHIPEPAAEEAAATPEPAADDIDVDALMAEAAEGTAPAEEPEAEAPAPAEATTDASAEDEIDVEAMMAEIADEGGEAADILAEEQAQAPQEEPAAEEVEPATETPAEAAPEETITESDVLETEAARVPEPATTEVEHLKAIPTASGLQVGFPVEVLAEALRPMVKTWVDENLPEIVERLVREELSKLADE